MSKNSGNNYGIQMDGGTLNAGNVAVGEGATINIAGDARSEITGLLDQIEAALKDTHAAEVAKAPIEAIREEVAAPKPNRSRIEAAISIFDTIGTVGGKAAEAIEKVVPLVAKVAALLL